MATALSEFSYLAPRLQLSDLAARLAPHGYKAEIVERLIEKRTTRSIVVCYQITNPQGKVEFTDHRMLEVLLHFDQTKGMNWMLQNCLVDSTFDFFTPANKS